MFLVKNKLNIVLLFVFFALILSACEQSGSKSGNGENGNNVDSGFDNNGEDPVIEVEIVEGNSEKEGDYLSMQIAPDQAGGVHGVFYYNEVGGDEELIYASKAAGGDWILETVSPAEDTEQQERADIGVDSLGDVHIIFGTKTPRAIWHAEKINGDDLAYTKITDLPNSPNHISLFVDGNDRLHVGYSVNNNEYRYAYKDRGGDWEDEEVCSAINSGYSTAIVVDQDDVIHYLHHSQRSMFHLFRHADNDEWSEPVELADGLSSASASVTLGVSVDGEGVLHAFFNDGQGDNNTRYLRKAPQGEFSEVVLGLSRTAYANRGICSPLSGGAFITFQPFSNWSMSAVYVGVDQVVSSPFVIDYDNDLRMGAHSSCKVDSDGNLHLLYNQSTQGNKAIKYAFVPQVLLP